MKALTLLYSFLGGAIVGCGAAVLLAPEKGADVREKICEKSADLKAKVCSALRKKGIKISDSDVDALVAELAGED